MNYIRTGENKIKRNFLAVLLFCAIGCILVGAFLLNTPNAARAEVQNLNSGTNASLFLPETYDQYLALGQPSDVALSASYIAIADGRSLYLFDKEENKYFVTTLEESRTISKIGFTANEQLFVSDTGAGNYFYKYSFYNHQLTRIMEINCSTFCISGDKLYTATVSPDSSSISEYSISAIESGGSSPRDLGKLTGEHTTPSMTLVDGILYCTVGEHVYYNDLSTEDKFSDKNCFYLSLNATNNRNVKSTCAHNNAFYYTTDGGLYRAELSTPNNDAKNATCVLEGDNFGALTSYGGSMYCIREHSVLRFDAEGTDYKISDYEISSSSASVGRLSGATDIVRAGSLVVIADTGNSRVTVYDGDTGTYSVLAPEGERFSPALVATDGTLVVAASGNNVYVCNNPKKSAKFETPVTVNGVVKGIACVYGKVYYVTQNNFQGVLNGKSTPQSNGGTPSFMSSDLYGNLYVAYTDTTVRSFTEEQFTSASEQGTVLAGVSVPATAKTMRADFEGGLYYLDQNGKLCGSGKTLAAVDGKNFVYTNNASKAPVSFALGFEDDEAYFCFGDFIVKSNAGALGVATLESVSRGVLETAQETLTAVQPAEDVALADFAEGAVGIHVDLGALIGDTPCSLGYARYPDARRGVLLSQQEKYSLVALYHDHVYSAELFRSEDVAETVSPENTPMGGEKMYLSSNCAPCNFPCILDAPARAQQLPRGTQVAVLAVLDEGGQEAEQGGYTFAYIEYETQARARVRGYVPAAYLSAANPLGDESEQYFLGYVKPGTVFAGSDGSEVTLTERTAARIYENGDGTYTARYEKDGVSYSAHVLENQIERGESDALRIALIIILSVLAAVIIGAYVFLLPRNKKSK